MKVTALPVTFPGVIPGQKEVFGIPSQPGGRFSWGPLLFSARSWSPSPGHPLTGLELTFGARNEAS